MRASARGSVSAIRCPASHRACSRAAHLAHSAVAHWCARINRPRSARQNCRRQELDSDRSTSRSRRNHFCRRGAQHEPLQPIVCRRPGRRWPDESTRRKKARPGEVGRGRFRPKAARSGGGAWGRREGGGWLARIELAAYNPWRCSTGSAAIPSRRRDSGRASRLAVTVRPSTSRSGDSRCRPRYLPGPCRSSTRATRRA